MRSPWCGGHTRAALVAGCHWPATAAYRKQWAAAGCAVGSAALLDACGGEKKEKASKPPKSWLRGSRFSEPPPPRAAGPLVGVRTPVTFSAFSRARMVHGGGTQGEHESSLSVRENRVEKEGDGEIKRSRWSATFFRKTSSPLVVFWKARQSDSNYAPPDSGLQIFRYSKSAGVCVV